MIALDIVARVAVALIGTGIAAYFDVTNNRNIPNHVTYPFVVLALLVNFISLDMAALPMTVGIAAAIFIIGYVFYKMGQIGGADILVITAIALAIPQQPLETLIVRQTIASPFPFVLSVIIGASLAFSVVMFLSFIPKVAAAIRAGKIKLGNERLLSAGLIAIAYIAFVYIAVKLPFFPPLYLALITFVMLTSVFFMLFREFIQASMVEFVPLSRVEEEDVLAIEQMDKETVAKYKLQKLLTLDEIKRLRKLPIKKFPVYTKMPMFLPYILFGLLLSLLFGDLLLLAAGLG